MSSVVNGGCADPGGLRKTLSCLRFFRNGNEKVIWKDRFNMKWHQRHWITDKTVGNGSSLPSGARVDGGSLCHSSTNQEGASEIGNRHSNFETVTPWKFCELFFLKCDLGSQDWMKKARTSKSSKGHGRT